MKKILSLILAALLLCTMAVPAAAEGRAVPETAAEQAGLPIHTDSGDVMLYGYTCGDWDQSHYTYYWLGIPASDPVSYEPIRYMNSVGAGAFAGGYVYGYLRYGADPADARYFIMDADTFEVGYTGVENIYMGEMVYNYANDTMYAFAYYDDYQPTLVTVDLSTGLTTDIGVLNGVDAVPLTLSIDREGNAYSIVGVDGNAVLCSLDLETAELTEIGSLDVAVGYYLQSSVWDMETDTLFWAQYDVTDDGKALYSVDVDACEAERIGTIGPVGCEMTALFTKNEIEIPAVEFDDVCVTLTDDFTGEVFAEVTVPAGTTLEELELPAPPVHMGLDFVGWDWDFDDELLFRDVTIIAKYHDQNPVLWDFETDPAELGFSFVDADGDGYGWDWSEAEGGEWLTSPAHSGEGVMRSMSFDHFSQTPLQPDNWMITPAFEGVEIGFWSVAQHDYYCNDYIGVYVSQDGGETWGDEVFGFYTPVTYTYYTVDLSDYEGELVVGFRHYNCTDNYWAIIDDIEVSNYHEPVSGDANRDGDISLEDTLLIMRHVLDLEPLPDSAVPICDLNGDGVLTLEDALLVLRRVLEIG